MEGQRHAAGPPYAGISRIRFSGLWSADHLSAAHQRPPGDAGSLCAEMSHGKCVRAPMSRRAMPSRTRRRWSPNIMGGSCLRISRR